MFAKSSLRTHCHCEFAGGKRNNPKRNVRSIKVRDCYALLRKARKKKGHMCLARTPALFHFII
ncbi:MAG: hypothetical protein A2Y62_05250 [Candidatus Fischerbacteria bacterium RBG_13_37_8]|uniref:Uncharacterized protein n=1 Tax=Candidatus Fischerbacteria bacterium RBG_13_37_8 TaxID=1817863 RepID=A0A1F5VK95_9BACT|nr:MAG: hypothetical protein A2Y62_05250 [Candidatus Fischerbacteria bacterium RBG_13_37_8]